MANEFEDEHNDFAIKDFSFLPSIYVELLEDTSKERRIVQDDPMIDLWEEDITTTSKPTVSIDKFHKYFDLSLKARSLKKGKDTEYIRIKFRKCTIQDFIQNGIQVSGIA